ncbi:MAG: bifunctional oligoribonuclease/PAP phosphatase NrnA [Anaerolineales bacterium]|nr:bifunctional oligoribonuclease/PAP phosphatase NrnA [Anaerolineales bacterium]
MSADDQVHNAGPSEKERADALADLLAEHGGERHAVILQEYPDPDAISSALAHRLLGKEHGIEVDLIHGGRVSHQENLALVSLLDLELVRFDSDVEFDAYDGAVFVDNQGTTAQEVVDALAKAGVPILAVVDHHEPQNFLEPEFSDIREIGATASIYVDYIRNGLVELVEGEEEHTKVATALLHGILSDTNRFVRATERDFEAAAYLSQFRDVGLLEKIMSQARSRQTMEIIQRALEDREIVESYSIVGVGYLRSEDRDAIPQAADFLMSEENVHTAIVFGIVRQGEEGEAMVGSMRTSKLTLNPDEFIKDVFGQSDDGRYFGGGKRSAGAFEIPIEFLAGEAGDEFEEMKWQVYDTQVRRKIYHKIGADEADISSE